MELGIISSIWFDTPVGRLEGIRKAKEIGFDTYDIFEDPLDISDAERAEIKAACDEVGLPIRSVVCVAFGIVDFNPSVRRFTLDRIKAYVDQGAFFGARNVLLVVGEYYWDGEVFPRPAIWDMAKGMVKEAGEYAQSKGLEIVLELEPFNEALLKDVHELVRFVKEIDHAAVRANADISHLHLSGLLVRRGRGDDGADRPHPPVRLRRQGARGHAGRDGRDADQGVPRCDPRHGVRRHRLDRARVRAEPRRDRRLGAEGLRRDGRRSWPTSAFAGRYRRWEPIDLHTGPDLPPKTDYGIGCIGAGFIMKDIHLVAYARPGSTSLRSLRGRLHTRRPPQTSAASETVYDTWQELLDDERVEILDIAYPPDQQLGIIREAVKRPHIKAILAQKPVAFTLDEAVEMVRLCDEAGVKLGVNHNMRYDQSMRALKSLLDAGTLGEPIVAEIVMNARPHWQGFLREYGRIALLNMSIHHLDAFRFQFGDPERIFVSVRDDPSQEFPHKDGSAFYILEYANGLRAIGLDNCYTWADHNIQWRVEGTAGIAKGTIGWPDYPAGSPSTITWTTRAPGRGVGAADLGRPVVPTGVQGHDGSADARDPGGRRAGDLGADDDRHDGARRGRVPLG